MTKNCIALRKKSKKSNNSVISYEEKKNAISENYSPNNDRNPNVSITQSNASLNETTDKVSISEFAYDFNFYFREFLEFKLKGDLLVKEDDLPGKKIKRTFKSGAEETLFNNGSHRWAFLNGYSVVFYENGDVKQNFPNETVVYWYKENDVTEIDLKDGTKIIKFGARKLRYISPGQEEISLYPNKYDKSFNFTEVYFLFNEQGRLKYLDDQN